MIVENQSFKKLQLYFSLLKFKGKENYLKTLREKNALSLIKIDLAHN